MNKSDVDELVVDLYLRLNGYFTTGLIIHSSEWGQARTEIDRLAIRHEYHSQDERQIGSSTFLELQSRKTELIFCEVKNDLAVLNFNNALLKNDESIIAALKWIGLFRLEEIDQLSSQIMDLLNRANARDDTTRLGVEFNNIVIRSLLCCPSEAAIDDGWILDGNEVFGYINQCFNPEVKRDSCSTRYNFNQWGCQFSQIVRYFKELSGNCPSAIGLYGYMGCA